MRFEIAPTSWNPGYTGKGRITMDTDGMLKQFEAAFVRATTNSKKNKTSIPIFLAPEWTFCLPDDREGHEEQEFSVKEKQYIDYEQFKKIINRLRKISEKSPETVMFAGSILWSIKVEASEKLNIFTEDEWEKFKQVFNLGSNVTSEVQMGKEFKKWHESQKKDKSADKSLSGKIEEYLNAFEPGVIDPNYNENSKETVIMYLKTFLWILERKPEGGKTNIVFNTAPVFYNGQPVHYVHKAYWGFDTDKKARDQLMVFHPQGNDLYSLQKLTALQTKGEKMVREVIHSVSYPDTPNIFKIDEKFIKEEFCGSKVLSRINFGLEVCADHGKIFIDKQHETRPVDIQVIVSCGKRIDPNFVATREGGIILICDANDGFNYAGSFPDHMWKKEFDYQRGVPYYRHLGTNEIAWIKPTTIPRDPNHTSWINYRIHKKITTTESPPKQLKGTIITYNEVIQSDGRDDIINIFAPDYYNDSDSDDELYSNEDSKIIIKENNEVKSIDLRSRKAIQNKRYVYNSNNNRLRGNNAFRYHPPTPKSNNIRGLRMINAIQNRIRKEELFNPTVRGSEINEDFWC